LLEKIKPGEIIVSGHKSGADFIEIYRAREKHLEQFSDKTLEKTAPGCFGNARPNVESAR
jgi:hypothetical protein